MLKFTKEITKSTKERVDNQLKSVLQTGNFNFDVHAHIFNKDYIPDKYFGIRIPFLVNVDFLMQLESLMDLISLDEDDKLSNYAYFIDLVAKKSMGEIADLLISSCPPNSIFCPLMMDFKPGIYGAVNKDIFDQLNEMKTIRDKHPSKFLPFVAISPNNKAHLEVFEKAFSKDYNFFGVKIYPSLGYLPSHPNLMKIYEICEHYDIPVTTHSGSGTVHASKNKFKLNYYDIDEEGKLILETERKNFYFKKQFEKYFNDPKKWEPVLRTFPKLRLNLAHFGGDSEWDKKTRNDKEWTFSTINLMERFPNVYSDVSYIIHIPEMHSKFIELFKLNKWVADRTLFGTDFYMISIEGHFKEIRARFVKNMGEEIMHKISVENPLNFLNLTDFVPLNIREQWQKQIL
ncbi:MAG: amidohydrolase family protein [Bacteroidales bacterium]|nr:amidohydrolase family protein [Bacteroidales bacterium]